MLSFWVEIPEPNQFQTPMIINVFFNFWSSSPPGDDPFWQVDQLLRHIEHESIPTKVMIGNKLDLESERKISYEDAQSFAMERSFHYFETSAKDGTNITEALGFAVVNAMAQQPSPEPQVRPMKNPGSCCTQ